jgi:hypothetical protein
MFKPEGKSRFMLYGGKVPPIVNNSAMSSFNAGSHMEKAAFHGARHSLDASMPYRPVLEEGSINVRSNQRIQLPRMQHENFN